MAKLKGLGRGLDALLGGDVAHEDEQAERLTQMAIAELRPGKYQPRSRMDPESIKELADSIKTQGLIQPILARPHAEGGYEIIAGERRWRAARMAGLDTVPVIVKPVRDEHALAMALIENIQREDLNPIEEAAGIRRLVDEFGMTHEAAAEAIGRSRSAVSNLLRLLSLPEPVQQLMLDGRLDMGHARALLTLPAATQIELAQQIAAEQLSARQAEQLANQVQKGRAAAPARDRDRDVVALEEELSDLLGLRVSVRSDAKGAGRLIIDYGSLDQLDVVLARLRA